MHNKVIVAIAVAGMPVSSNLVCSRKKADSAVKPDVLGAAYGFQTCADLRPTATFGLKRLKRVLNRYLRTRFMQSLGVAS